MTTMPDPGGAPAGAVGPIVSLGAQPDSPDPILVFEGISKAFFGIDALRDVSFSAVRGHILGLIGENGAGKSTLMNILGGVIHADSGRVLFEGQEHRPRNPHEATEGGIAFIHQELNLFTNLTVAENLFIGGFPRVGGRIPLIDRRLMSRTARAALKSVDLNVSPDTLVESLTPGERQLVEIAKALQEDSRLIIFDEPTTSLTIRETKRLFDIIERLRREGRSIIYISHILADVRRLCDELVVLRDGKVVATGPKEQFPIRQMIAAMVGRDIELLYPDRTTVPTHDAALEVRGLSQPGVVRDISLVLHRGEILGVFGLMGSGRSELARILFGLDPFETGEIVLNGAPYEHGNPRRSIEHGLSFVTENRREEGLLLDVTITENLGLVALPRFGRSWLRFVDKLRLYQHADETARSLRIRSGSLVKDPAKSLSGGNQQKVVVGKWLMAKPAVFILDEPTRGVDVGAKVEIYSIINDLAAQGAAMLVISSELEELLGTCDRIIVMANGEIQREFPREAFQKDVILQAAFREEALAT